MKGFFFTLSPFFKEEIFDKILSDPSFPLVLFSTVRHPLDRLVILRATAGLSLALVYVCYASSRCHEDNEDRAEVGLEVRGEARRRVIGKSCGLKESVKSDYFQI